MIKITYCVFNILAFGYWDNSTRILFTFSFTFWCFSKTLGKWWTWFQFLGCHWVTICCAWRTLLDPFKSITSFYCKNLSKKREKIDNKGILKLCAKMRWDVRIPKPPCHDLVHIEISNNIFFTLWQNYIFGLFCFFYNFYIFFLIW